MAWILPFFLESYTHCHSSPSTESAKHLLFARFLLILHANFPPFTLNVNEYCCSCYLPMNGKFTHPRWILIVACTFGQTCDKQSDGRKALLSWLPPPLPQSYNQLGNKRYLSFHSFLMKRKWRLYSVFKPSSLCLAGRHLSNLPSLKSSEEKDTIYCQTDYWIWYLSFLIPTDFSLPIPGLRGYPPAFSRMCYVCQYLILLAKMVKKWRIWAYIRLTN